MEESSSCESLGAGRAVAARPPSGDSLSRVTLTSALLCHPAGPPGRQCPLYGQSAFFSCPS
uniref:Uncharacterized protein n=1 Tax=Pavo cristatus TaxID=9049 RepID=A0A8C9FA05_PAVCR